MGNTQPKKIQESKFVSNHPKLNDAKVIVEQNNRKYIEAKFKAQNAQFSEWQKNFKEPKKLKSDYLLLPEHFEFKDDVGLCGNTGTLTAQYPYFPHLLSELIKQRQSQKQMFKESELWFLLYALVAAKQDIRYHSKKLGDIKPQNIFVDDEGLVKIVNVFSWTGEVPSYFKALDQIKPGFNGLLAPEDLLFLQTNHLDNDKNQQSQMFAIGATIMSAGILQDMSSVYNYSSKTLNQEAFKEKKRIWSENEKYFDIFKSIIWNLMEVNPSNRLTMDELWNFMLPYQSFILEKKQFIIPQAPAKIENSLVALKLKSS